MTGAVAVLVAVTVSAVIWRRITAPTTPAQPESVDAVVLLSGGHGERLPKALELMENGVASTLVVSTGNERWIAWDDLEPLCDLADGSTLTAEAPAWWPAEWLAQWPSQWPPRWNVVCVTPEPDNTRGEATTVADMAAQQGWESVALVTSGYHVERATIHFRRCFEPLGAEVWPVAAEADVPWHLFRHEALGILHARTLDRSCR